jgi:hypothetical protein
MLPGAVSLHFDIEPAGPSIPTIFLRDMHLPLVGKMVIGCPSRS